METMKFGSTYWTAIRRRAGGTQGFKDCFDSVDGEGKKGRLKAPG